MSELSNKRLVIIAASHICYCNTKIAFLKLFFTLNYFFTKHHASQVSVDCSKVPVIHFREVFLLRRVKLQKYDWRTEGTNSMCLSYRGFHVIEVSVL